MDIDKNTNWNQDKYNELIKFLESLAEEKYKLFNQGIVSTKYEMLGIRIPILRNIVKKISKSNFRELFTLFKDEYFESIMIEGLLISYVDNYDEMSRLLKKFVKKIDNWAICDTVVSSLKFIGNNKEMCFNLVNDLLSDSYEYSKRLAYVILLDYYVSKEYLYKIFNYVKNESSDTYYVNMAISWLLCECFIKFPNETYDFISCTKLSDFVIRKTVSKVNDSYRVSKEDKTKLRDLKTKIIK